LAPALLEIQVGVFEVMGASLDAIAVVAPAP